MFLILFTYNVSATEIDALLPAHNEHLDTYFQAGLFLAYVKELRSVLGRDVDRSRFLLSRLLGEITLRPAGRGLVADLRGDLGTVLESVDSSGAGRGI